MINDIINRRKSIKSFLPIEIESEKIRLLFEAAALAPSSHNEQPWSFLIAIRNDRENFMNMLELMNEKNKFWAKDASIISLAIARKNFAFNGKQNKYYFYDVSSAIANLTFQAISMGLFVHQVGGFDSDKARQMLNIPDHYDPVSMLVVGYSANEKEIGTNGKTRKPLEEYVFERQFGNPANLKSDVFKTNKM